MSTPLKRTLLGGGLVVAAVTATGVPTFIAQADPARESTDQSCDVTTLPGRDGDVAQYAAGADSTGTYVAGMTYDKNNTKVAALWSNGRIETVDIPGDVTEPQLIDVNSHGQALGNYQDAEGSQRLFVYADGEVTELDDQGEIHYEAAGINDEGTIIGSIAHSKEEYYPVVWNADDPATPPAPLEMPSPDATGASPRVVDNDGDIAGRSYPVEDIAVQFWKGGEGEPEELSLPNGGDWDKPLVPTAMAGDLLLASAADQQTTVHFVYAPGEEPVEYTAIPQPEDITPDGWVAGLTESGAALVSPDGDITELSTPEGFESVSAMNLSADHSVITGTVSAGENAGAVAQWTCQ